MEVEIRPNILKKEKFRSRCVSDRNDRLEIIDEPTKLDSTSEPGRFLNREGLDDLKIINRADLKGLKTRY